MIVPSLNYTNTISDAHHSNVTPNVDYHLQNIFDLAGMSCNETQDCYDAYDNASVPSNGSYWLCLNANDSNIDNGTEDMTNICIFDQCSDDIDCDSNELCWIMNICNDNNEFYNETFELYSTICLSYDTCATITYSDENYNTSTDDIV